MEKNNNSNKYNFLTLKNIVNITQETISYSENILPRNETILKINSFINNKSVFTRCFI